MKKEQYNVLKANSLTTDGINEATDDPPDVTDVRDYDEVERLAQEAQSESGFTEASALTEASTRPASSFDLTVPLVDMPLPKEGEQIGQDGRVAYLLSLFGDKNNPRTPGVPYGFFAKYGTEVGRGEKSGKELYKLKRMVEAYVKAGAIPEMPSKATRPYLLYALESNFPVIERLYEVKARAGAGGAEGEGLRRKKGRGIAKGVDYDKGIEPLQKYAPLGQYYINQQKLKDDIITCCRADGRNAGEWKAKRVSLPLANLIRKLVGKGKPTFDDLNELSEEDKHILAEFIRKAKLDLDIPNSKIDREDLNQFEIMKGQIMAGNDSTELIKKFKLLIVKLCNDGRLPKGQGKGILLDLASLGY